MALQSLYYSTTAGATLDRQYSGSPNAPDSSDNRRSVGTKKPETHKRHVIVASEPTTYKKEEWTSLEKNQLIIVGKDSIPVLESGPDVKHFDEVPVVITRVVN